MRRVLGGTAAIAVATAVVIGLSGCGAITNLISGEDDVYSLKVGDCFDSNESVEVGEDVTSVPTVDCEKKHDLEVYASVLMDQDEYPGEADTTSQADAQCSGAFEGFLGASYDVAVAYEFTYFYPSTQSWAMGDREILCMIYAIDEEGNLEQVSGTLRDAEAA